MIKVWGRVSSSNVQALMWTLAELDLPYERHDVGLMYGGNNTPAFLSMNPNGTIPVFQDGDTPPLWETGAILRYVAGQYADDTFWPQNAIDRAGVDKWAEWAKINIALKFTAPVFWRVVRTAPSQRDPQAIQHAVSVLNKFLAIAEQQLSQHAFLAADHLTLADIQFGHILFRYFEIDIDRPEFPNIQAYYQRLKGRAAYMKHVAVSYEELRVSD